MMIKKRINKKNNGFSLAELLTSITIFSMISMILFLCFNSGQKYLADSTSKLDSERGINIATQDINFSIRNGAITKISVSENQNNTNYDGTGYISTSSASIYSSGNIINNDLSYNISGTSSELIWNFQIVYFTAKLPNCQKCIDLGLNSSICPHKYLIKRYYTLNDTYTDFLKWSENKDKLNDLITQDYNGNRFDKILARNVIAFLPLKQGKSITYSIKLLKDYNLVKNSITEDKLKKTINAITKNNTGLGVNDAVATTDENDEPLDPLSHCTTQINYTAIPLNK